MPGLKQNWKVTTMSDVEKGLMPPPMSRVQAIQKVTYDVNKRPGISVPGWSFFQ